MAQVTVTINGRGYQIRCDDGQEDHVLQLAGYVDERVRDLTAAMGPVNDARLLVMASLLIADELADANAALAVEPGKQPRAPATEAAIAQSIEALAARIEDIAARLEAA